MFYVKTRSRRRPRYLECLTLDGRLWHEPILR